MSSKWARGLNRDEILEEESHPQEPQERLSILGFSALPAWPERSEPQVRRLTR
jgi:hypothetical protein